MRRSQILLLVFFLFSFIVYGQQVTLQSTNLPLFIINTRGQTIVDEPKIVASLKIISNTSEINKPTDIPNIYNANVGIEIRGVYSKTLPQLPYSFETIDWAENVINVSLLGFPKENDWVLLANYNDKSFVRNTLMFDLFRKMGHYAPRAMHCELILNDNYEGIYIFTEKIKWDKNRVDIPKMDIDDNSGDRLTGGYIFKMDYSEGDDTWNSNYTPDGYPIGSVNFVYSYPKPNAISSRQKTYLKNHVDKFEDALFGENFKSELTGYRAYIDVNSFVDYFIIGEISRNVDAYKKSCNYYKKRESEGGLIFAGPVWDFDWAMKNFDECIYSNTDGSGWAYKILECNPWPIPPAWIPRIMEDSYFANKINTRYFELRNTIISNQNINSYIDSVATLVKDAQERHYTRWPILGENVGTYEIDLIPASFEAEMEKLKNWFSVRLEWLDANMVGETISSYEHEYFTFQNQRLTVYPNPATDYIHILSDNAIKQIQLLSIEGKIWIQIDVIENYYSTIETKNLIPGMYLIKILTDDNMVLVKKFVKK